MTIPTPMKNQPFCFVPPRLRGPSLLVECGPFPHVPWRGTTISWGYNGNQWDIEPTWGLTGLFCMDITMGWINPNKLGYVEAGNWCLELGEFTQTVKPPGIMFGRRSDDFLHYGFAWKLWYQNPVADHQYWYVLLKLPFNEDLSSLFYTQMAVQQRIPYI